MQSLPDLDEGLKTFWDLETLRIEAPVYDEFEFLTTEGTPLPDKYNRSQKRLTGLL